MHITIEPREEVIIKLKYYKDSISAYIEGKEYRGMDVQAKTIEECLKGISKNLSVVDAYKSNIKVESELNNWPITWCNSTATGTIATTTECIPPLTKTKTRI